MSYQLPPIPNVEMARALFQKSSLPEAAYETNLTPRFQTINTKVEEQSALSQAKVFNSLIQQPTQMRKIPRRWRLAAYSTPIEYATLTLGMITRYAIIHGMAVKCCSLEELTTVNKYPERYELVFVHDVFDDYEPGEYRALREAHSKNFHLFYSMTGNLERAVEVLKVSPDYAFQIQQAAILKQSRTI